MHSSTQRVFAGRLSAAYETEVSRLQATRAISKLWNKQPELWSSDSAQAAAIRNRLGWIAVIDRMKDEARSFSEFAEELASAGVVDIVLLGMGGASLAAEVFSLAFPPGDDARRFFVLDTTDPSAVMDVRSAIDLAHTVFVVASKSGKTLETLSQFQFFHQQLSERGSYEPGRHFIAITDEGSPLDGMATENEFLRTYRNPGDIGGRYSALSYSGLVPAALWGADVAAVLASALEMRATCGPQSDAAGNPGLQLGALLGAAAGQGVDKLALVASPTLRPLGSWIEQLIAESTGKQGKGIVPIAGAETLTVDVLSRCVTAALVLEGDDCAEVEGPIAALEARHAPVVEIHLSHAAELGGEFFKWEVAIALAGATLGVNPFDEPNVQESKDNTARILDQFQTDQFQTDQFQKGEFQKIGNMPIGKPIISESGIELYASDLRGKRLPSTGLADALQTFFAVATPDDYLALLAYVERDEDNTAELEALRGRLSRQWGLPVLLGFGPRYMHSIGQLYKDGPATGMFLVITATSQADLAIPGAKYTFGQLEQAQALGDLQALNQRGKAACHLHLVKGAEPGLPELGWVIEQLAGAGASNPSGFTKKAAP